VRLPLFPSFFSLVTRLRQLYSPPMFLFKLISFYFFFLFLSRGGGSNPDPPFQTTQFYSPRPCIPGRLFDRPLGYLIFPPFKCSQATSSPLLLLADFPLCLFFVLSAFPTAFGHSMLAMPFFFFSHPRRRFSSILPPTSSNSFFFEPPSDVPSVVFFFFFFVPTFLNF